MVSFGLLPNTARNVHLIYSTLYPLAPFILFLPLTCSFFYILLCLVVGTILSIVLSSNFALPSQSLPPFLLPIPAYGLGSLSDDDSGVGGVVDTLGSEGDRVVHAGLLQTDSSREGWAVWLA